MVCPLPHEAVLLLDVASSQASIALRPPQLVNAVAGGRTRHRVPLSSPAAITWLIS